MRRRLLVGAGAALPAARWADARALAAGAGRPGGADGTGGAGAKIFRYALRTAETGFDPPRVSDQSSIRVLAHIFEPPLTYDWLARPARLVPLTAAALPEIAADFKRAVFTIRSGIRFADDPAFGGRPRELVAQDYVYTIKRFFDPALRSEHLYQWENLQIVGLSALRRQAIEQNKPFDYDAPVAGLRALDRYRFEIRLERPAPRLAATFTGAVFAGAVAREVVERYGDDLPAHPVGTGPFRLAEWRRASRMVLVRNERFRDQRFDADPPDGDPTAQAVARRLAGARAPLVDRIELDVIEEAQPRWLAFLNRAHDAIELPSEYASIAVPGGRLAPFLARHGVRWQRAVSASVAHTYFNFDDALVGGYAPAQVALRRAIALAYSSEREIRLVRQGQGQPAQGMIPPGCYGHDPALVSEAGRSDPTRAAALLDLYGYLDRDRDGWRELPDGRPLTLRIAFTPHLRSRQISELWLERMTAVGLKVVFEIAPFGELIKRSLAGQLMMWGFTWGAGAPDGDFFLALAYGPNARQSNDARFRLAAYDRLYERQAQLPDGPERAAIMRDAARTMLAYMPYIPHLHEVTNDLAHAHVHGLLRRPFGADWWRWVDVDAAPA